jgi:hypothetical protein
MVIIKSNQSNHHFNRHENTKINNDLDAEINTVHWSIRYSERSFSLNRRTFPLQMLPVPAGIMVTTAQNV